jgi:glutamyl-tRNA synthetase
MVNFMVLLGWSLDDKTDIMSRDVLLENFSLDRIGHAGAIFDKEKLLWMNGAYIRQLSHDDLAERMMPFLERDLPAEIGAVDMGYLRRIVPLAQERLKTLGDAAVLTSYFFEEDIDYAPGQLIQKGMDIAATLAGLMRAHEVLGVLEPFDSHSIEETLRSTCAELYLSGRQFFGVLRVAATGRTAAPPLFETLEVLGRVRCLKRIESAVRRLESEGSTAGSAAPVP